jgi:hypothetical protein
LRRSRRIWASEGPFSGSAGIGDPEFGVPTLPTSVRVGHPALGGVAGCPTHRASLLLIYSRRLSAMCGRVSSSAFFPFWKPHKNISCPNPLNLLTRGFNILVRRRTALHPACLCDIRTLSRAGPGYLQRLSSCTQEFDSLSRTPMDACVFACFSDLRSSALISG